MENKVVPVGKFVPYTLDDLSVVIPQASQYKKRIKWFIPQYLKGTPWQVAYKNTIVVYDPEDLETKAVLDEYKIRGITVTPPHSTYKMEAGFKEVKTRLCVRIHNDAWIRRSDWAERLIDQFNVNPNPQLIGAYNLTGGLSKEIVDAVLQSYPAFKVIYDQLQFDNNFVSTPFMSAFFMASQTYVMQGIYPQVVRINQGSMNREDCLFTLLVSLYNIQLISWSNMYDFIKAVSKAYGDFEDEVLPTEPEVATVIQPVFKEVI